MKFIIDTADYTEVDDILRNYPNLITDFNSHKVKTSHKYCSEFLCLEIDSIEELMRFENSINCRLIVESRNLDYWHWDCLENPNDYDGIITIYDNYIE